MENKEIVKILEAHKEWIEHPEKSKGKVNELILAQAIGFAVSKLNLLTISVVVGQSEQLKAFLQEIENDKTYILNDYYKNKAKRLRESL